jgi:peptide/nickel transport system permease protein
MTGVLRLVAGRLVVAAALLLAVSALLFVAVEVLPGDAATTILGQNATPERLEQIRADLGLDRPVVARYLDWIGGVVQGDFGDAVVTDRSVWSTISTPLRNTAALAVVAFTAMVIVAVAFGVTAGVRPGSSVDQLLTGITSVVVSVPDFVLGTVLIAVLASWFDLLPSVSLVPLGGSPWDDPSILLLPAATMALVAGAFGARLIRAVVAEGARAPHVEAARLAGLSPKRVVRRHLLPGLVGPIVQVLASLAPFAIGGTIVVERLFGYPGIGAAFTAQLAARDVAVVEAIGLVLAAAALAALVAADVIGILVDPRRRALGDARGIA